LLLYLNDIFALHETGQHPECVQRITRLNHLLRHSGWTERASCPAWQPAGGDQILRVHERDYLEQLRQWCLDGGGQVEVDTVVSEGSWPAALHAAGAAIDAVRRVVDGQDQTAFCAIRPPGHHALVGSPMGFCLLNNVAIAALEAINQGLERVLIIDWDVHHGNGTQDVFYDDGRVGFFSMHRSPFYPGTGKADETGTGDGLGTTLNIPVPMGISRAQYFDLFRKGLETLAEKIRPHLILISAGFDAHPLDPVGGLCLEESDFAQLTQIVRQVASTSSAGRIVSLLEGGYHLEKMPDSVVAHLQELDPAVDAEQGD
jgi:acetoin utilization deacetylase AcuC-like enzyme